DDLLARRDVEQAPEAGPRELRLHREGARARHHPPPAHVLAERGHRQLLGDLRLLDVRAAATPADDVALPREVVERRADREPRDAEIGRELPLGRDRRADAELLDQLEHLLARHALLRHPLVLSGRRHCGPMMPAAAEVVNAIALGPVVRYRSDPWPRSCSRASRSGSAPTSSPWTTSRSRSRAASSSSSSGRPAAA